ncbi:MAG: PAS domain S-box protein, partial [Cyanobacteria bacterium J083]
QIGVQQVNNTLPELEKLLLNRQAQLQLKQVNYLIQAKFANLERAIELYQLTPLAIDTAQASLTQENAALERQIQSQLAGIKESEQLFLQQQTNQVTTSLRQLTWVIVIFFSLSISLLGLIYWLLQQQTQKRQQAELQLQQTNQQLQQTNGELKEEIAKQQLLEKELRQSEAQFRSLTEYSPIGIVLLDTEGNCIYANPRYLTVSGCEAESVLGKGWLATIHPDDLACIEELLAQEVEDGYCEIRFCLSTGESKYSYLYLAPVFDQQQRLISYVGALEDITERRKISQMKDEFIALVSHELRTPLASIQGSLGLLAAGILRDRPATAQQMLEIAALDTERLSRLVNDILDLNRLEAGRVEINPQWHQADDLIQQAIATVQAIATAQEVNISVTNSEIAVWADSDWIVQTLVNLLTNAIKFSPPQSRIEVTTQLQAKEVLFTISDQGRGIPAEKLEQIFQRFQQVKSSDRRQQRGTGLGLSICRLIVRLHGGRIWAESKLGEGSTFFFTLPLPAEKP